ncbi:MAG: ABC transporter ATP-binding protein [Planctomyces sp.]|jgi:ABC-2 type transport system ATP-binding protein
MAVLLDVAGLCKSYGALKAVDGVSFQVGQGEAFGLLGPNGAGKSTTMMMIAGLLDPDAGEIRLGGHLLSRRERESRLALGVVPQDLAIYPDLTARENLQFFGRLYQLGGQRLQDRVEYALRQTGLDGRADDYAGLFSGGMKRRLNFAAAILHEPRLLILDEPTVGVDPQSRAHLLDCVRQMQQSGTAIIYASHYMEEVQQLCSRAAIVDRGRLLVCDFIAGLLQQIPLEVELRVDLSSLPGSFVPGAGVQVERDGGDCVLRLVSDSGGEANVTAEVTRVLQQLVSAGAGLRSIRTHDPSLERLFLKLTGSRLRD